MAVDLTRIPQLARNLNRVIEIAAILAKYGFADWLARLDARFLSRWVPVKSLAPITDATHEARLRLACTELGTTFIKLGQMLSTRRDLIGRELAAELSQLQTQVPADPFEVTRATIEAELRQPLSLLFPEFEPVPIASGSIGQVHRARLPSGRLVAVKVQHPGIRERIEIDLAILTELAALAEEYLSELQSYRPVAIVQEFQRVLLRELDFRREFRHLQLFRRHFRDDSLVRFPEPIAERSSIRILTLEYLEGIALSQIDPQSLSDDQATELARRGAVIFLEMIFRDGFFHADPHPGNILLMPGGVIGLLDAGMVGRVDDRLRGLIEAGMSAVIANDAETLTDLIVQIGEIPIHLDQTLLRLEVADQLAFYWGMPLDQFQLAAALEEFTEAIRRYQIILPPPLALLLKVLIMLEGTARLLSPRFNLVEVLQPYQRRFLRRRLSPRFWMRRFWTMAYDWDEVVLGMPRMIRDLMQIARKQQFAVQLEHHHLESSVNRLVFGLLVSSLFVGSAMLWAYRAPPLVGDISLFGISGCLIAFLLGLRLFRAIQRSGRLYDS